jgi:hypothetical protein
LRRKHGKERRETTRGIDKEGREEKIRKERESLGKEK